MKIKTTIVSYSTPSFSKRVHYFLFKGAVYKRSLAINEAWHERMFESIINKTYALKQKETAKRTLETFMLDKTLSQSVISKLLNEVEKRPSYYAGGTLFIDLHDGHFIYFNLNETYHCSIDGKTRLLDLKNVKLIFDIYKRYKGENEYYKEKFSESVVKFLN